MKWLNKRSTFGTALVAALALASGCRAGPGQAAHAVLGGLGPGQRAGRAVEGLHRPDRRADEVRVRALAELRAAHAQRAQLQGQALRPADRRQPVDRLGRDRRPLHQAQRVLRQERHQDERLHAGHRRGLLDLAQGHEELLGAARDGRRGGLHLPQGLVRPARAAGRVQGQVQPRARAAHRPGTSSSRSASSSRTARSTARRSTARRSTPSAAPKASRWA